MLDKKVQEIADAAFQGAVLNENDIEYLLSFDAYSTEVAYVCAVVRQMTYRSSKGRGFIHTQIGVDQLPCPINCAYCSFAKQNVDYSYDEKYIVSTKDIVHYAQIFDECGVQLISLMATAALPLARYLEMINAVRTNISNDTPIMANYRDVTEEEAQKITDAGANIYYHARRLPEGILSNVDPKTRFQTMRNVKKVGMALMSGVDPLWHNAPAEMVAKCICELPEFEPYCVGACGVVPLKNHELKDYKRPLTGEIRYVGALSRLVCENTAIMGGAANALWVDAGCDARKRDYGMDDDHLRKKIAQAKNALTADGWVVPDRAVWDIFS